MRVIQSFYLFFFSFQWSIHTQTLTRLSWLYSKRIYCNTNLMQLPFTFLKFFLVRKSNYCHLAFVSPQRQGVQMSRKASCWIRPRYSEARTSQQRAGRRLGLQIMLLRAGFGRSECPPCHHGMSPPGGAGLPHGVAQGHGRKAGRKMTAGETCQKKAGERPGTGHSDKQDWLSNGMNFVRGWWGGFISGAGRSSTLQLGPPHNSPLPPGRRPHSSSAPPMACCYPATSHPS